MPRLSPIPLTIATLTLAGFALTVSGPAMLVPLAVTAWTLGARHAFDPDHIAAIDSAARTLSGKGQGEQAATVGFWFALGHAALVTVLAAATAAGAGAITTRLADSGWGGQIATVGPLVAAVVLIGLGLLNLAAARRTRPDDTPGGLVGWVLPKLTRGLTKPSRMVAVGALFGLGFDTATEVSLLVLAAGAAAHAPWWATLSLPVLFAAGMTLFDTLDSALLTHAYTTSTATRRRQLTAGIAWVSSAMAITVGGVMLAETLSGGRFGVEISWVGFASVAALVIVVAALAVLRRPAAEAA